MNKEIKFVVGDDWHLGVNTLDADSTAIDLTGHTITAMMKGRKVNEYSWQVQEIDLSIGDYDLSLSSLITSQLQSGESYKLTVKSDNLGIITTLFCLNICAEECPC